MIEFFVTGTPGSKGSHRAFIVKGHAVVAPGGSAKQASTQKAWEAAVKDAAQDAIVGKGVPDTYPIYINMPVELFIRFYFRRPKSHFGKRGLKESAPTFSVVKPDIDKAVRATADPLIGVIYDDDSRVSRLIVEKVYTTDGREGAYIAVRPCVGHYQAVREVTGKDWSQSA